MEVANKKIYPFGTKLVRDEKFTEKKGSWWEVIFLNIVKREREFIHPRNSTRLNFHLLHFYKYSSLVKSSAQIIKIIIKLE